MDTACRGAPWCVRDRLEIRAGEEGAEVEGRLGAEIENKIEDGEIGYESLRCSANLPVRGDGTAIERHRAAETIIAIAIAKIAKITIIALRAANGGFQEEDGADFGVDGEVEGSHCGIALGYTFGEER